MLKSGLVLTIGNAVASLLGLGRNIFIARLIGIEDFGIASTFAISLSLIEMSSDIGLNRLLVQARDGEKSTLQATIHGIQVVRGLLGALVLFLAAGPIAVVFGVPDVKWAYQLLALVPLLRGFAHFDMFRFQRESRFLPSISVELSAQGISTVSAVLFGLYFRDYRAMLYSVLLQQLSYLIVSHLVSSRPYRLRRNREILGRATSFGMPLLLNAMLMFAVFQGDRVVVGNVLGMDQLGWFSAAFTLTLAPTLLLAKTLHSFMLPQLSRARDDNALFASHYRVAVVSALLIGATVAVFFALFGPLLLSLLYGPKYEQALFIVGWLGIMQSWRVAKAGPAIVAIASGTTTNPLWANVVRALFIPIAWLAAVNGAQILSIVAIATVGEMSAFFVSLILLRRIVSKPVQPILMPLTGTLLVFSLIGMDLILEPIVSHEVLYLGALDLVALGLLIFVIVLSLPVRSLRATLGGCPRFRKH